MDILKYLSINAQKESEAHFLSVKGFHLAKNGVVQGYQSVKLTNNQIPLEVIKSQYSTRLAALCLHHTLLWLFSSLLFSASLFVKFN